jgi:hypothetical protein
MLPYIDIREPQHIRYVLHAASLSCIAFQYVGSVTGASVDERKKNIKTYFPMQAEID